MKRTIENICIALLLLLVSVLIGCDNSSPVPPMGELKVIIGNPVSRALEPEDSASAPAEERRICIVSTFNEKDRIEGSIIGSSFTVALEPGSWNVTVTDYYKGHVVGVGSSKVDIAEGVCSNCVITIEPSKAHGRVYFAYESAEPTERPVFNIVDAAGRDYSLSLGSYDDGRLWYDSVSLPVGAYRISYHHGDVNQIDSIFVTAGSEFTLYEQNGELRSRNTVHGAELDAKLMPGFSHNVYKETLTELTAEVDLLSSDPDIEYRWYLNGLKVTNEATDRGKFKLTVTPELKQNLKFSNGGTLEVFTISRKDGLTVRSSRFDFDLYDVDKTDKPFTEDSIPVFKIVEDFQRGFIGDPFTFRLSTDTPEIAEGWICQWYLNGEKAGNGKWNELSACFVGKTEMTMELRGTWKYDGTQKVLFTKTIPLYPCLMTDDKYSDFIFNDESKLISTNAKIPTSLELKDADIYVEYKKEGSLDFVTLYQGKEFPEYVTFPTGLGNGVYGVYISLGVGEDRGSRKQILDLTIIESHTPMTITGIREGDTITFGSPCNIAFTTDSDFVNKNAYLRIDAITWDDVIHSSGKFYPDLADYLTGPGSVRVSLMYKEHVLDRKIFNCTFEKSPNKLFFPSEVVIGQEYDCLLLCDMTKLTPYLVVDGIVQPDPLQINKDNTLRICMNYPPGTHEVYVLLRPEYSDEPYVESSKVTVNIVENGDYLTGGEIHFDDRTGTVEFGYKFADFLDEKDLSDWNLTLKYGPDLEHLTEIKTFKGYEPVLVSIKDVSWNKIHMVLSAVSPDGRTSNVLFGYTTLGKLTLDTTGFGLIDEYGTPSLFYATAKYVPVANAPAPENARYSWYVDGELTETTTGPEFGVGSSKGNHILKCSYKPYADGLREIEATVSFDVFEYAEYDKSTGAIRDDVFTFTCKTDGDGLIAHIVPKSGFNIDDKDALIIALAGRNQLCVTRQSMRNGHDVYFDLGSNSEAYTEIMVILADDKSGIEALYRVPWNCSPIKVNYMPAIYGYSFRAEVVNPNPAHEYKWNHLYASGGVDISIDSSKLIMPHLFTSDRTIEMSVEEYDANGRLVNQSEKFEVTVIKLENIIDLETSLIPGGVHLSAFWKELRPMDRDLLKNRMLYTFYQGNKVLSSDMNSELDVTVKGNDIYSIFRVDCKDPVSGYESSASVGAFTVSQNISGPAEIMAENGKDYAIGKYSIKFSRNIDYSKVGEVKWYIDGRAVNTASKPIMNIAVPADGKTHELTVRTYPEGHDIYLTSSFTVTASPYSKPTV